MADAKRTTVEKIVAEKKKVTTVTLTLSQEEAAVLFALTGNLTGDSVNSPRKHTDAVYCALSSAGVRAYGTTYGRQMLGSLKWLNEPKAPSYRF